MKTSYVDTDAAVALEVLLRLSTRRPPPKWHGARRMSSETVRHLLSDAMACSLFRLMSLLAQCVHPAAPSFSDVLKHACRAERADIVIEILSQRDLEIGDSQSLLECALDARQWSIGELILEHPRVDVSVMKVGDLFEYASGCSMEETVRRLLSEMDPSTTKTNGIGRASEAGQVAVVELLLTDARINPAADGNYAIQCASRNGHLAVVELLLADNRVDPAANDNYAIRYASGNGHLAVVELLLADSRVDPAAHDNDAIQCASSNGHPAVVELLLADSRVNPAANDNEAIRYASAKGRSAVVELLLADARIDPAANDNEAVRYASLNGHSAVVYLLLADNRVDPAANNNPVASG